LGCAVGCWEVEVAGFFGGVTWFAWGAFGFLYSVNQFWILDFGFCIDRDDFRFELNLNLESKMHVASLWVYPDENQKNHYYKPLFYKERSIQNPKFKI
jgi:hypothetical protein